MFDSGNRGHVSPSLSCLSLCGDGRIPWPIGVLLPYFSVFARFLWPSHWQSFIRKDMHIHSILVILLLSLSENNSSCYSIFLQLPESKALDSSILDFWAASGLAPKKYEAHQEDGIVAWPSCDSLLSLPVGSSPSTPTLAPDPCKASSARQLKRKKALMQLHLTPHKSPDMNSNRVQVHSNNLTTLLTLSGKKLLKRN